jgi:hypothetical protein
MKKTIIILSLSTLALLNGCATPGAVEHDSKVAWEGTKKASGEVWEGTKKVSGEAWDGTKKAVNNATTD